VYDGIKEMNASLSSLMKMGVMLVIDEQLIKQQEIREKFRELLIVLVKI
jgi:phage terminase large subunit-like protein